MPVRKFWFCKLNYMLTCESVWPGLLKELNREKVIPLRRLLLLLASASWYVIHSTSQAPKIICIGKKEFGFTEHCFLFLSSSAVISKNLIMRFTKPRHMMEKDRSKSNLKLIFQKDAQKCVKMTKSIFGKVRKALGNMSALTSEKGLVFREVRAGQVNSDKSSSIWVILKKFFNFLILKKFLRNSWQHTVASHWTDNSLLWRHSRLRNNLQTCLDFSFFVIFTHFCDVFLNEFEIRFSPVFFHYITKITFGPLKYPYKNWSD